jgi:hypothetical protein
MTKLLDRAIEAARALPAEMQDELARMMLQETRIFRTFHAKKKNLLPDRLTRHQRKYLQAMKTFDLSSTATLDEASFHA